VTVVIGLHAELGDVGHGRQTTSFRGWFRSATEQLQPVGEPIAQGEPAAMDP
jgi:hypothetical protein